MKRLLTRLLTLVLVAGVLAVTLTPVAARQCGLWREGQIAGAYRAAANEMSPLDCGTLLAEARSYAEAREAFRWSDPFGGDAGGEGDETYDGLLKLSGNGVMAVLEIPKLGLMLPVYHGTRNAALGAGVGHMADSGLPVGDAGAPCVLVARGDGWFAGPFAQIDRLIAGDCFYIHVLQDTLIFEVSQSLTVFPEALGTLKDDEDAEECVLLTTAPYGADTQRLLVRGKRVPRRSVQPSDDTQALPGWAARMVFAAPLALAGLIALAVIEGLRRAVQRHKRKRLRI